jgi:murein DD-endopeptidase MepM/ murein hydrolase activator NlpD
MGFDTRSQRRNVASKRLPARDRGFPQNYSDDFDLSSENNDCLMKPNRIVLTLLLVASAMLLTFTPNPFPASASEDWRVPVDEPRLLRAFLQPSEDWSAGHRGVDYLVQEEQPVYAAHSGVVSFVGLVVNRSVVSLRHPNGLVTSVEPVCPGVKLGDYVQTGQQIGFVCVRDDYPSHCGLDTCLHFSLRSDAGYLSPLVKLRGLSPSRLKPWGGLSCSLPSSGQC